MIRIFFVVATLLLGGGIAEAQDWRGQQRAPEAGPIQMLLAARHELKLTPDQITRLEGIDAEMDQLNQPLVAELSAIRHKIRQLGPVDEMTPERRKLFESYIAEGRPVMQKIEGNNRIAMRKVGEILTDEQRAWIAEQLRNSSAANRERSPRLPWVPGGGN